MCELLHLVQKEVRHTSPFTLYQKRPWSDNGSLYLSLKPKSKTLV